MEKKSGLSVLVETLVKDLGKESGNKGWLDNPLRTPERDYVIEAKLKSWGLPATVIAKVLYYNLRGALTYLEKKEATLVKIEERLDHHKAEIFREFIGWELRKKVLEAFKELRKEGILARANFTCCQTCGGYDLGVKADAINKKKLGACKGWVFWHRQDNDRWDEDGTLTIAYTGADYKKKVIATTLDIGVALFKALEKQGLKIDWCGSDDKRITVVGI